LPRLRDPQSLQAALGCVLGAWSEIMIFIFDRWERYSKQAAGF